MLYTLIPPIIVVLSAIGIIIFLVKKSPEVSKIKEDMDAGNPVFVKKGIWGRMKTRCVKGEDVKHFFLAILEKMTRKFRIVFLKLESKCSDISSDIRVKRQARINKKANEVKVAEKKADDVLEKLKNYKDERINKIATQKFVKEEEEIIRPMLSDKIAVPEKNDSKEKLEELLIERIALNPKDIEAYERLGEYYMEMKIYSDAKDCFKQVIKLNPTNRNIKYKIRRLEYLLSK